MKKIVVAGIYNQDALVLFQTMCPSGYSLEIVGVPSEEELIIAVSDADVLFVRGRVELTDELLRKAKKLRLIQKWGAGFDQYDMVQIGRYNIPFMNCAGVNSIQVAEMTFALILALYRRILPVSEDMKQGIWSKERYLPDCHIVYGKEIGVVGLGNIGRQVVRLAQGFGATVRYYDEYRLPLSTEQELGVEYVPLETLLAKSDIVTLHVPLLSSTKNLINAHTLSLMKPSAVLINAARGGIVDEKALYSALIAKTISGAALDVLEDEEHQSEQNNPLFDLPNVVITPHMGASTAEVLPAMVQRCYDNVLGVEAGTIKPTQYQNYRYFTQTAQVI